MDQILKDVGDPFESEQGRQTAEDGSILYGDDDIDWDDEVEKNEVVKRVEKDGLDPLTIRDPWMTAPVKIPNKDTRARASLEQCLQQMEEFMEQFGKKRDRGAGVVTFVEEDDEGFFAEEKRQRSSSEWW